MSSRRSLHGSLAPAEEPGRWQLDLDPEWVVFSFFGGMALAALLDAAIAEARRPDLKPVSASALFCRPLRAGPAVADVEVLRAGRSTVAMNARLSQGEGTSPALTLAVLLGESGAAADRDPEFPRVPGPDSCEPLAAKPVPDPGGPRVHANVDWRCLSGWGPDLLAWVRPRRVPRTHGGELDRRWYPVAADLLGPAVVEAAPYFPFTVATVALEVQLLRDTRDEWLLQRARGGAAGRDAWSRLQLWDRGGHLIAFANQRALLMPADPADLPYCVTGFGEGRCRVAQ